MSTESSIIANLLWLLERLLHRLESIEGSSHLAEEVEKYLTDIHKEGY